MQFLKKILLVFILFLAFQSKGQENSIKHNEYYTDKSDQLILRLYTLTKLNTLEIIENPYLLTLAPNGQTNLGIGFNYKISYRNTY